MIVGRYLKRLTSKSIKTTGSRVRGQTFGETFSLLLLMVGLRRIMMRQKREVHVIISKKYKPLRIGMGDLRCASLKAKISINTFLSPFIQMLTV